VNTGYEAAGAFIVSAGACAFLYERHRIKREQRYEEELEIDYDEYEEDEPWPAPPAPVYTDFYQAEKPTEPEPEPYYQIDAWRHDIMSQVTNVPATLLRDGKPVIKGDLLDIGNGRQVKVMDITPDSAGGILVTENYRTTPEALGCVLVPEKVVMELSPDEAKDFLSQYQKFQAEKAAATPADTAARAYPLIQDLQKHV
jgi:hypothetical protein